jgi:hypothetical protein
MQSVRLFVLNLKTKVTFNLATKKRFVQFSVDTIKWLLILCTLVFIGYKLFAAYEIHNLFEQIVFGWTFSKFLLLLSVLVLLPLNICIEAIKWQLLIGKFEKVSFLWSLRSLVSGIALGVMTPNNLGDFVGRVMHLEKLNKWKGALVAVIGHTAQVMCVAIPGVFAFIFMFNDIPFVTSNFNLLLVILILLSIGSIFAYFHMPILSKWFKNRKLTSFADVFGKYSKQDLLSVFLLSLLRYIVFTMQYVMLTQFFEVGPTFVQSTQAVVATLCAQIFMPSFLLVEIGMRGASALFFLGIYSNNVVAILLSAYTLWIINIMLPTLWGLIIIYHYKYRK